MTPIRLVIFEDNKVFRESLLQLFRFTPDIEVVASFPDCASLPGSIEQIRPDVILMDIDMPGMNGIDATGLIKNAVPDTQIIMLTVSEEDERVFNALRNGASGYLLKKTGTAELIDSIRTVHVGGSPITPAIARKVLRFFQPVTETAFAPKNTPEAAKSVEKIAPDVAASLTPREREMLEGLVDGLSYKLIAARFDISPETVKNHIQVIYRKMHVNSKGEAIARALLGK